MATICQKCEHRVPEGKAQCPHCLAWQAETKAADESVMLGDVESSEGERIKSGPWDYIWGGGLVRASVTLFGGLPGAGKSTLLLQMLDAIYRATNRATMYVATEEALKDIKARADRLRLKNQNKSIRMVPAMGGMANPAEMFIKHKPSAIVLDSLQGMTGTDDNAAIELLATVKKYCVLLEFPAIVISHVNKAGDYAGLMTFQHAVDTLITLTPDEDGVREMEVLKNRYGRAFINMTFQMTSKGLIADEVIEEPLSEDEEDENEEEIDDSIPELNSIPELEPNEFGTAKN